MTTLMTSCGILKSKTDTRTNSEIRIKEEEKKEVENTRKVEENTYNKEVSGNEKDRSREASVQIKGGTEVIPDVELKEGLNVLSTESGGTVFAVKDKDGKLSLIINRPDINVFNKDYNITKDLKEKLKDSTYSEEFRNKEDMYKSKEEEDLYNNRNIKTKTDKTAMVVIIVSLLGVLYAVYLKIKNKLK